MSMAVHRFALALLAVVCSGLEAFCQTPPPADKFIAVDTSVPGTYAAVWYDETSLLVGGLDSSVRLFHVPPADVTSSKAKLLDTYVECVRHLTLGQRAGSVLSLATDARHERILIGTTDSQVTLWNLNRTQPYAQPPSPLDSPINLLTNGPEGRLAVAAGKVVAAWNKIDTVPTIQTFDDNISSLAWTTDGSVGGNSNLIVGLGNGGLVVCDGTELVPIEAAESTDSSFPLLVTVPNVSNRDFVTLAGDWNRRDWRVTKPYAFSTSAPVAPSSGDLWTMSPDGKTLIEVSGRTLLPWKLSIGSNPTADTARDFPSAIVPTAVAASNSAKVLAVLAQSTAGSELWIVGDSPQQIDLTATNAAGEGNLVCMELSADGTKMLLGFASGNVYTGVLDLTATPQLCLRIAGEHDKVAFLRFVGGSYFVSASTDGRIRMWEPGNTEELALVEVGGSVTALDIAPSTARAAAYTLAVAKQPNVSQCQLDFYAVQILSGGASLQPLSAAPPVNSQQISTLHFSPDANRLTSTSDDRLVRVWDVHDPSTVSLLQVVRQTADLANGWIWNEGSAIISLPANGVPLFNRLWVESQTHLDAPPTDRQALRFLMPGTATTLAVDSEKRTISVWNGGHATQTITLPNQNSVTALLALGTDLIAETSGGTPPTVPTPSALRAPSTGHAATIAVAALNDRSIHFWAIDNGKELGSFQTEDAVTSLTQGADQGIVWATLANGKCLAVDFEASPATSTTFTPADSPAKLSGPPLHVGPVTTLARSEKKNSAVLGCRDGGLFLYTLGGQFLPASKFDPADSQTGGGQVYGLSFGSSGKSAAAVCGDSYVFVWPDIESSAPPKKVPLLPQTSPMITPATARRTAYAVAASTDPTSGADKFVAAGPGAKLVQLGIGDEAPIEFPPPPNFSTDNLFYGCLAVSRQNYLVAGLNRFDPESSYCSSVGIVVGRADRPTDSLGVLKGLSAWETDHEPCYAIAFSPIGDRLAAIKTSGQVQVWQQNGPDFGPLSTSQLPTSNRNNFTFCGIAWSCKGRRLALTAVPSRTIPVTTAVATDNVWILDFADDQ
jgi:WD40 repeat protein